MIKVIVTKKDNGKVVYGNEGGPEMESKFRDDIKKYKKTTHDIVFEEVDFLNPDQERKKRYGSIQDQLDMIYHDKINGTDKWVEHITKVKGDVPKKAK